MILTLSALRAVGGAGHSNVLLGAGTQNISEKHWPREVPSVWHPGPPGHRGGVKSTLRDEQRLSAAWVQRTGVDPCPRVTGTEPHTNQGHL